MKKKRWLYTNFLSMVKTNFEPPINLEKWTKITFFRSLFNSSQSLLGVTILTNPSGTNDTAPEHIWLLHFQKCTNKIAPTWMIGSEPVLFVTPVESGAVIFGLYLFRNAGNGTVSYVPNGSFSMAYWPPYKKWFILSDHNSRIFPAIIFVPIIFEKYCKK